MMADHPTSNLTELLSRAAATRADHPALVDGDRVLTWSALDDQVDRFATGLGAQQLVGGQRVALMMPNRAEFVVAYLGVARAGLVAVPLNPGSTAGEVARVLDDSGARAVVADETTVQTARVALAELAAGDRPPVLLVTVGARARPGEKGFGSLLRVRGSVVSPRDPESLALLMYTSGTSGRPQGAMLSHRALVANVAQAASTDPPPVQADDVVLGVLPMFHVYGLNAVLGQVLNVGATLVLGRRFDPDETLRLVESSGATCVPVAPPVVVAWNGRDDARARLASVRVLLSGAAPLAEDLVRSFEERTGLVVEQGYGLTEAAPIVTTTLGTPTHKPGSTGRAVPGVELRVVDDGGDDVEADDPGEVWVRGANLFSGYWPDGDGGPDDDGWLATGDIGFLDPDGDLFMVDRLKELVIVSGFNVYPSEIEDVIGEVDGVRECAVIGVPDARAGEAVVAYVVAADGADPAPLPDRVAEHCAARLARFKLPSAVQVVAELPRSATGKVAKGRLRATEARRAMGLT